MERHRKANSFPDLATPGDPRLLAAIERRTPGIAGGGVNHLFGGTILTSPRKVRRTASPACPFGKIIDIPDSDPIEKGIAGGIIYCGDQTWNMDPDPLTLGTPGVWLVSISVSVEVNRDDDESLILPGIKTGTRPTGAWTKTAWTDPTDYPSNTAPSASTGMGTIKIPLGKLTIAGGVATFEKTGCGHITIGQCAGTLSHTRG